MGSVAIGSLTIGQHWDAGDIASEWHEYKCRMSTHIVLWIPPVVIGKEVAVVGGENGR